MMDYRDDNITPKITSYPPSGININHPFHTGVNLKIIAMKTTRIWVENSWRFSLVHFLCLVLLFSRKSSYVV